ncbi:MAG: aminotransferase class I/II-fold pyridoxal phosphate-dependent enzyme [Lachnospiraceae bacterium]|nr:aminotransferase class I/II-fold pyridoxal phosphate-dependent enzyme [Lachnospiraceae bacterium]
MEKDNQVTTPVYDFVRQYRENGTARFHMPGHKGRGFLGFEDMDITEIKGADALYESDGIIAESERNATKLFDSGMTLYSAEGSSLCIKAMLYAAFRYFNVYLQETHPVIFAARNVHKSFIYAAALTDCDVVWFKTGKKPLSICSSMVTPEDVEDLFERAVIKPAAVYITSPDYLGRTADIKGIADVCHRKGVLLIVDNAHGAYLKFSENDDHPLTLGADMCCDSAHKTLPVLTGGAYLHLSKDLVSKYDYDDLYEYMKSVMCMNGSTSPSYLIMASLDKCNEYLSNKAREDIARTITKVSRIKDNLSSAGYDIVDSDPLKLTIRLHDGNIADFVRGKNIEPEYADRDYTVFMISPFNTDEELDRLHDALIEYSKENDVRSSEPAMEFEIVPFQTANIRFALKEKTVTMDFEKAQGKMCGFPLVSCPPAVPIIMPGELVKKEVIEVAKYYGYEKINVVEADYR